MPMFVILKKSCFGDNDNINNNKNNNNKNLDSNNKYIKNNLISINRNSFQNNLNINYNNNNFVLIKNNNNNDKSIYNIINKYFNNIILIIKSFKLIIIIYNKTTKMILNIINYNNQFYKEIFFLNNYDRYISLLNNNNKNKHNNNNTNNNYNSNTNNNNKNKYNNNDDKRKNQVNDNNNMHNSKRICNIICKCNQKNSEQYIFDDNMCYCRSKQYNSNDNNNNNKYKNINNNNNIKKANCDLKKLYHSDNIDIITKNINNNKNKKINNNNKTNNNNIAKKISNVNILKSFKHKKSLHISILFLILLLQFKPTFVYGHNNNYNNDNNNNQTIQELYTISSSTTTTTASAASTISTTSSLLDKTNQLNSPSAAAATSSSSSHLTSFITRENTIRREPNLSYTTSGCHSCQLREQVKADNLASIKRHILLRLELKTLPNITSPIVPREIIEKFYKNHSIFNQNKNGDTKYNLNNNNSNNNNNRDKSTGSKRPINSPSYDSMQGDDPRTYIDYTSSSSGDDNNNNNNDNEDYEEEFFSIVNSLYVFPTMPRMRHNRKSDILHFSFSNNGHSSVSQAILHVYIRGKDWIYEYERSLLNNSDNISTNRQDIIITINRVLRRQNSQNSTHTQKISEIRQQIPNGMGKWITVDVTDMVTNWFNNPNTNHGIVVKTLEQWMKPLVISDDNPSNKAYALYIEILTKDNRKRRTKRNTSLNCSESDNEERCCRYPLEVDFRKFNWDWIVAPTSFNAYFCNGECKLGFLPKYPHTHIMQLSTAPQPCCSPTKMSAISLLYFNNDRNLVMSTIPNMAVDKCSCS